METTTFSVNSIMKLLRWIFSLTYCEYKGKHYVLDCGPIGLSVVGEIAIIYMEDEEDAAPAPPLYAQEPLEGAGGIAYREGVEANEFVHFVRCLTSTRTWARRVLVPFCVLWA